MKKLSIKIDGKTISTKRLAEHLVEHEVCNDFTVKDFLNLLNEEIKRAWGEHDGGEDYPRWEC